MESSSTVTPRFSRVTAKEWERVQQLETKRKLQSPKALKLKAILIVVAKRSNMYGTTLTLLGDLAALAGGHQLLKSFGETCHLLFRIRHSQIYITPLKVWNLTNALTLGSCIPLPTLVCLTVAI